MRAMQGELSFRKGQNAEKLVAISYERQGAALLETRWRGSSGEIDLILQDDSEIVFCEVKTSSCRDAAIASLQPKQMQRIHAAASEYLNCAPKGQLSDVRFDLAVVDGTGRVEILKSAFSHF